MSIKKTPFSQLNSLCKRILCCHKVHSIEENHENYHWATFIISTEKPADKKIWKTNGNAFQLYCDVDGVSVNKKIKSSKCLSTLIAQRHNMTIHLTHYSNLSSTHWTIYSTCKHYFTLSTLTISMIFSNVV